MSEWQATWVAAVPVLALIGAGIRWLLTWFLNRRRDDANALQDRREKHDKEMIERFEKLEHEFLTALKEKDQALERHRTEHLADTKTYAASLAQVTAFLQKLPGSQRPPPER